MDNKNLRLLIIEDEHLIHDLYECYLEDDCDIDKSYTCVEGIEKFLENPNVYDVVITDLNHKGKNGVDVIKTVQKSSNPYIPVFVATGGADDSVLNEAKQLVEHRLVMKPLDFSGLKELILKESKDIRYQKRYHSKEY